MRLFEKITVTFIIGILTLSFSIFGVWEEKMTFLAPLIALLYVALALWAVAAYRNRGVSEYGRRGVEESNGPQLSAYSQTPKLPSPETLNSPHADTPFLSKIQIPPGGVWSLLFWAYSAALIPFSVIPYEAKISTLRLGCYVGTYWAVANILSRFPRRKAVWVTLLMALVLVACYSLVHHNVAPNMVLWAERYTDHYWGGKSNFYSGIRLGGTYICPNHFAHLFQMWIPLCLVFVFMPRMGWFWRICSAYAAGLFAVVMYQTQSRAGLLGLIIGLATAGLLLMLRRSRKTFVTALLAAPLLVSAAIGGLWAGSTMFRERMQPVAEVIHAAAKGDWETMVSSDWRPQTWADSLTMVPDRPLFGVGPGNYGMTFPEYRQRILSNRMVTTHPHNEFIELVTEYGWVGVGLFVAVLIAFCIPMVRLIKTSDRLYHALPAAALLAALAGTLVHGLFDFELRIFPNALMLAVLAGCAVSPLCGGRRRTEDGGRKTEDGGRRAEDGRRKTEDGGRRTEDGGRKTEDGGLRAENRGGKGGESNRII